MEPGRGVFFNMAILRQNGNRLIREMDGEKLWIEGWGKNGLRVRCTRLMQMDESNNWALLPKKEEAQITISGQTAIITNGLIQAKIHENGKISFLHKDGRVLLEEFKRTLDSEGIFHSALKVDAREFSGNCGNTFHLIQRFESIPEEKLFGMGQYQQSILNLKGAMLELAQRNSQASVPFLISDQGYGFLWNNPAIGKVTFATNVTEWQAESTNQLDYWITAGNQPSDLTSSYMEVTGFPPMMPEYAMGFWQCKLRYRTQDELLQVAREYKKRGIPLSVIVIDYFHWPNQGVWDFDKEYWPNPKEMVDELDEMGIKLMVSVWPTVDSESPNYGEMLEKGYLVQTNEGVRTQMQFLGNETFYDATNPEAREYVWEKCKKSYFDLGIETFWLDVAEPEYQTYDFKNYRYHLGSNMQVGNIYPMMYAKGFFDGLRNEGVEKPLNLLRCAWAGSQRYGALVWSGDINSTFVSMKRQVMAGLNMAMSGIHWWTTDIGGFNNGDPRDPEFQELLIRWFQYGTFCPVMRLHGYRKPYLSPFTDKVGGGMCDSGADNEVWSFGDKAYEILIRYINLREEMREYIEHIMRESHEKGIPPMRPLFYDFPDDKHTWDIEDTYMFGEKFLVAPVLEAGVVTRSVYLPKGAVWEHMWTKEIFEGGQIVEADAPLENIPVFLKR